MKKLILMLTLALSLGVVLSACGSDDSDGGSDGGGSVEVTDVWARATTPTQDTGAIYMTISSGEGDTLKAATVPTSIAGKTEIHETTTEGEPTGSEDAMESETDDSSEMHSEGGDAMHGDSSGAMMGMKQISSLDIPAGETVTLEPGGFHIMLLELKGQIDPGEAIPLTLTFEKAGEVKVEALARDE